MKQSEDKSSTNKEKAEAYHAEQALKLAKKIKTLHRGRRKKAISVSGKMDWSDSISRQTYSTQYVYREYKLFSHRVLPNGEVAWVVAYMPTRKAACFKTGELLRCRDILGKMSMRDVLTIGITAGVEQMMQVANTQDQLELVD